MTETQQEQELTKAVCPAAKDPAIRLAIVAAMLIGFGVVCYRDRENYPEPKADEWTFANINKVSGYILNNWLPYAFVPAGVVLACWTVVFLRRVLVADAEGIGYAGKKKIPWSGVTELDISELKTKGILYLYYDENKSLTLDSWKLGNYRALISVVDKHVPKEKHVSE